MSKRIILDTNALMAINEFKLDVFSAIERGMNEPYELVVLDGVLDDIKQQRMFAQALDNRVKTMNSELIRIDVKMCQAFGIRPDTDRIARADGKTDARRD